MIIFTEEVGHNNFKTLTRDELVSALLTIPADTLVTTNAVGNLTLLNPHTQDYIGYICLGDGTVDIQDYA